ncbi:MAG: adenosylhomocysteinase [Bacteroidaceae bacterium]|nr:adenosylhomocysteinase [Bacteroidaceae bacterium]
MDVTRIDALIAATYRPADYPVCHAQAREWSALRPLENLTVLDATPIFRNTLVKHRALLAAGARLIVGRATGFPCDDGIVRLLRDSGIPVVASTEEPTEPVDVVLDCAASFIHWTPRVGVVELTRSGVPKYADSDAAVFVADSGRIKRIETCLGTGESYFRAMKALGHSAWKDRTLVIFGSGKVGLGLLTYARQAQARPVVVTQPNTVTDKVRELAAAVIDCTDTAAVAAAIAEAYAVVTATGVAGALADPLITAALLRSDALLANMGVEDEYGEALPADRVLNGKRTLNFQLDEPTHLKYIDATLGLHNEGILYLLRHPAERGLIEPPADLEERLLDITRRQGCIGTELETVLQ